MDKREKILEFCKNLNLDLVGFTRVRKLEELVEVFKFRDENSLSNEFEESDIEKRINPSIYMEEGKTIISIAFPYFHLEKYIDNGFSMYTKGYDYHRVLHKYLNEICGFINSLGGEAIALVDSNTLPERYLAYLSGIGFIGKNNMLITKKYGSYVFLGEIITNLDLGGNDKARMKELLEYKECGECTICFNECPTKAINKFRKNTNICVSYLTQKKELSDKEINLLNGRIFGCDSCQLECPYNEAIESSSIEEFKILDFMKDENYDEVIDLNNSRFKETFKETSCGWRGKNVLIRNAMIRKVKIKGEDITRIESDSPYIKNYKIRLL